ncbi:MAG: NADH-quinone oxidoreductase subunit J [Anaerolineae bacterium]
MSFELVLFLALAGLAVLFAVGMLLSENAVHSALFLIGNFGCVAVLYLMLEAPFIGMVQIAVYAGAIMVLFLFVIMLLGAEQTTDTTRRFRWLTGAATVLAASFFSAIVAPLVLGGVVLPTPTQQGAMVRFVHAAGIPNDQAVNVTVSGGSLSEPLVLTDLNFGDVSPFFPFEAGTYNVLVQAVDGSPVMPPARFSVEDGTTGAATVIIFGEFNLDRGTFPTLSVLPQDFTPTAYNAARVLIFNAYGGSALGLADLGPNQVVDTRRRSALDETGEPVLDENGQSVQITTMDDPLLVPFTGAFTLSQPATVASGTGAFALVDEQFNVIKTLFDFNLAQSNEHLIIVAPDYLQFGAGPGTYRPTVLRHPDLSIQLAAPFGSPASIGQVLFTDYLLPVNVVGMLLLVALVGVVVLTRPDSDKQDRRVVRRRKVSRPLTSVISTQTGGEITDEAPKLPQPRSND